MKPTIKSIRCKTLLSWGILLSVSSLLLSCGSSRDSGSGSAPGHLDQLRALHRSLEAEFGRTQLNIKRAESTLESVKEIAQRDQIERAELKALIVLLFKGEAPREAQGEAQGGVLPISKDPTANARRELHALLERFRDTYRDLEASKTSRESLDRIKRAIRVSDPLIAHLRVTHQLKSQTDTQVKRAERAEIEQIARDLSARSARFRAEILKLKPAIKRSLDLYLKFLIELGMDDLEIFEISKSRG